MEKKIKEKGKLKDKKDDIGKKKTTAGKKSTTSISTAVGSEKAKPKISNALLNEKLDGLMRDSAPSRSSSSHIVKTFRGPKKAELQHIVERIQYKLDMMPMSG